MNTRHLNAVLKQSLLLIALGIVGIPTLAGAEEYDPTKGPGAKRVGNWSPSGTRAFDPAACKRPERGYEGYIYWAAGKQVFRFRYYTLAPIFPIADKDVGSRAQAARKEIPQAPDSTEPEGCYLNPLRAGGVPYMNRFAVDMFEKLWGQKFQESTLHPVGFYAIPAGYRSTNVRIPFDHRTSCWVRSSGMEECWTKQSHGKTDYSSSRVYRIDKFLLPAYPNSMDVYCSSMSSTSFQSIDNMCDAVIFNSVGLNIGLRIDYFANKMGSPKIDLNIDYLRVLMTYLINAQVSNYQWIMTK